MHHDLESNISYFHPQGPQEYLETPVFEASADLKNMPLSPSVALPVRLTSALGISSDPEISLDCHLDSASCGSHASLPNSSMDHPQVIATDSFGAQCHSVADAVALTLSLPAESIMEHRGPQPNVLSSQMPMPVAESFLHIPTRVQQPMDSSNGGASTIRSTFSVETSPTLYPSINNSPYKMYPKPTPESSATEHNDFESLMGRLRSSGFTPSEACAAALSVPIQDVSLMHPTSVFDELKRGGPISRDTGWRSSVDPIAFQSSKRVSLKPSASRTSQGTTEEDNNDKLYTIATSLMQPLSYVAQQGSEETSPLAHLHQNQHSLSQKIGKPVRPIKVLQPRRELIPLVIADQGTQIKNNTSMSMGASCQISGD